MTLILWNLNKTAFSVALLMTTILTMVGCNTGSHAAIHSPPGTFSASGSQFLTIELYITGGGGTNVEARFSDVVLHYALEEGISGTGAMELISKQNKMGIWSIAIPADNLKSGRTMTYRFTWNFDGNANQTKQYKVSVLE